MVSTNNKKKHTHWHHPFHPPPPPPPHPPPRKKKTKQQKLQGKCLCKMPQSLWSRIHFDRSGKQSPARDLVAVRATWEGEYCLEHWADEPRQNTGTEQYQLPDLALFYAAAGAPEEDWLHVIEEHPSPAKALKRTAQWPYICYSRQKEQRCSKITR